MPCRYQGVGEWYPSMPCRSPGLNPGGKLRGLAWGGLQGGLQANTQGGLQAHTRWVSWPTPGVVSRPTLGGCWYLSMHRGRHPPPTDGYCCGRYASYWNAFLLALDLRVILIHISPEDPIIKIVVIHTHVFFRPSCWLNWNTLSSWTRWRLYSERARGLRTWCWTCYRDTVTPTTQHPSSYRSVHWVFERRGCLLSLSFFPLLAIIAL